MSKPIDINRAAWCLIQRYGDDCAKVAYARSRCCRCLGDPRGEGEWKLVIEKVVQLHFSTPSGKLH
ncbi:MAG: hypothetical protein KDJ47_15780 [Hyphomicrobiaceae bacterium]|nr:hypothetical protein [Hyphomicrobiaceae bacterium]